MKMVKNDKIKAASGVTKGALVDIIEYNKKVIDSWLKRSGTCTASIQSIGPEAATIRVCVNGKGRVFIICFGQKDFRKVRSPRLVRIDPRAMDPFGKDDKVEMERLRLVMFFAEHLDNFEKELVGTPQSKKLYNAWLKANAAMFGAPSGPQKKIAKA